MTVTDAMVNGHGIAHGGYVFLLADTAFACACNSHGPVTVAAGAEINFVAPARGPATCSMAIAEERITLRPQRDLRRQGPARRRGDRRVPRA